MIKNLLTLVLCLGSAILSALVMRSELQLNDLSGVQLISLIWVSLELHYIINTGINFGIAGSEAGQRQSMFASLALIISMATIIWIWRTGRIFTLIAGGLFSGGGLSNAYERVFLGGVFAYLNISATFYQNPYSFNLADLYIFVGFIVILFSSNPKKDAIK